MGEWSISSYFGKYRHIMVIIEFSASADGTTTQSHLILIFIQSCPIPRVLFNYFERDILIELIAHIQ